MRIDGTPFDNYGTIRSSGTDATVGFYASLYNRAGRMVSGASAAVAATSFASTVISAGTINGKVDFTNADGATYVSLPGGILNRDLNLGWKLVPLHASSNYPRDIVGRGPHGLTRKMRLARRCLHLAVTEQFADHGQSLSRGHRNRSEGMAQVVDPDVLEPGAGTQPMPEMLQVGERLAGEGAGYHVGLNGCRSIPASTPTAACPRFTTLAPVLESGSRSAPAWRSTCSQRSFMTSFTRQPLSSSRRTAAMAPGSSTVPPRRRPA